MKNAFFEKISIKLVIIAFILPFMAFQSFAQFNPIQFERDSLPNGLQIVYHLDKSAPVVATVVHYRVGSRDEIIGKTGYAHLFEHLMFEATDDIPRASMDKYVLEAGGNLNAHTSWDETVYHFKVPSNEIKLALWIESQRMRKLHVDSVGVNTQKGVVREELKMRVSNQPYGTLIQKICENLFSGSTYGWAVVGYDEDLATAKISDFKTFYDSFYQPSNAVLVIAGDFNIDEVKKYVRDYFGDYPRAEEPKRPNLNLAPIKESKKERIEDTKAQLPGLFIAYRGPKMGEDDAYALSLLSEVLASGNSSRLYQRLVDKEQVAVASTVFPLSLQYVGGVVFYAIASYGKSINDIQKYMDDEIEKVIKNGITEEELTKAKNITEADFISQKKNVLEKAQSIAKYFAYYGDPALINTEIDKYMKVTKEDVIAVAKKYFSKDKRVVLEYVPKGYKD
jgi:zinc protease